MGTTRNLVVKDVVSAGVVLIVLYLLWGEPALHRLERFAWLVLIWAVIYVWRKKTAYGNTARRMFGFARWLSAYALISATVNLIESFGILSLVRWNNLDKLITAGVVITSSFIVFATIVAIYFLYYRMVIQWSQTLETHSKINFSAYKQRVWQLIKLTVLTILVAVISVSII